MAGPVHGGGEDICLIPALREGAFTSAKDTFTLCSLLYLTHASVRW